MIRLTERDLTRLVKRMIMESSDLQSQFESMIDEIGEQVIVRLKHRKENPLF
jgi:hypothetical protein